MALVYTNLAMFVVLVVASYIFYQRIKMAQMEYDESRGTVQNITSMFSRQVKRMESEINRVEREALQAKYMANEAISAGHGSGDAILAGLEKVKELNTRVENIETSIGSMRDELKKLASQPHVISHIQPLSAPIPVEGNNIIQQITETEMEVLKMIVDLGEGTVPEIKDVIGKTREHTARLLKKLYELVPTGFVRLGALLCHGGLRLGLS